MWGQLGGSLMGSGGSMLAQGLKPEKPEAADGMVVSNNQGGMVPGNEFAGDRVDAQVNSGEMIINVEQQQNLLDLLAGKTNQIDASQPIVQDTQQGMGQDTTMQNPQQPMEGGEEMDPLAAARQMQEQQAPKLAPDFQPTAPTAPMTPPQEPIDMLAGAPQEQPIQAADGAVAPMPWQQEVYGGMPPQPEQVMTPQMQGPAFAQEPTPIEALTTDIMTQPYQPHPDDMPPQPIAPVAQGPTSSPNVQQMEFEPIQVTSQSPTPKSMVEGQNPIDLLNQKQQQQPQQPMEEKGKPQWVNAVGKGVAGVGDAVSAAFGGKTQGFQQIMAKEEREKDRALKAEEKRTEKEEREFAARQERLQKQADEARKREQQLGDEQRKRQQGLEDFSKKERLKKGIAEEARIKEGQRKKSFQEVRNSWSGDQTKTANLTANMIDEYSKIENLLAKGGFSAKDIAIRTPLVDAISAFANFALRKDSGAAIGDVERAEFAKFLPQLINGTVSPGLLKQQVGRMQKWVENVAGSLGTDLPSFTDHMNTRISGFYKTTLPGGFFKYGQKTQGPKGEDLSGMDDPQLEAESAKWEAENAR